MRPVARRVALWTALAGLLAAAPAAAQDLPALVTDTGRFHVGGYGELQLRALSDSFEANRWYLSQWAMILNVEPELDIVRDGWGPFDSIGAFARIEVRYECVWTGCQVLPTWRYFGDRATRAPASNWTDARTEKYVGAIDLEDVGIGRRRVHRGSLELLNLVNTPRFERAFDVGLPVETVAAALGPLTEDVFAWKKVGGPRESLAFPLGPWNPSSNITANGALVHEPSFTLPLPLRPPTKNLYTPSSDLRRKISSFDSFDQNFRQRELEWNHGGSQDEWELKEAYLDFELFDGRLWIRAGKQNIVWGKTELFRTTDQFNPQDIALASLPSLEESRIALWSIRGIWSFYDVGPFQDVRLELAMNFDDFEPIDTGRCGEPYTVWLICAKSTALVGHGATGTGLAGERHPPNPWNSWHGLEFGGRLEFRWRGFSFAVMDFYGFDDIPSIDLFNTYERNVDPRTGRPLDALGRPLKPSTALEYASGNRQAFDFGCRASQGFGQNALLALTGGTGTVPDISQRCIPDIVNLRDPLTLVASPLGFPIEIVAEPTNALGALLAGQFGGNLLMEAAINGIDDALAAFLGGTLETRLAPLNQDPGDGPPGGGIFGTDCDLGVLCGGFITSNVSLYLSPEQEALIGCGPFYGTDCDVDGIDLFQSEASVLLQSFPGFGPNPVGTRFENGKTFILPGARGPGDPGYNVLQDGTPPAGFDNEMAALSFNFAQTIAILGIAEGDTECDLQRLETCAAIRTVIAFTGSQRPEIRAGGNGIYGRRDFVWLAGGEAMIYYPKRNVFGISVDFAEDRTKTNWGIEFTWVEDQTFASNTSRDLLQEADVFNLTVSVDRPTFINFLNQNRTFFINSQVFFRYVPELDRSFDTNGPISVLATLAITTGYFQDRLTPTVVFVHDFRSTSGGIIGQLTYRATEVFSVTFGVLAFYGGPERNRIPQYPIALFDTDTNFNTRTRFEGLSAISERDEVFVQVRYTF